MDLLPFKRLISDKCGLEFKNDVFDSLPGAIKTRMTATGAHSLSMYLDTLLHDHLEFESLIARLTVNETYFMREPRYYTLLVDRLVPAFMEKRLAEGKKIRIFSAGCSTGEEPYSVLIALAEKYGMGALEMVSITACDIHPGAIKTAQKGVYGAHSFRGVDASIKAQF